MFACVVVAGCTNVLVAPSGEPTTALASPVAPASAGAIASPAPTASTAVRMPTDSARAWPARPQGATESATLVRIVDGDTIRAVVGGVEHPIRYIGIDTPESAAAATPVEALSLEAAEMNRRLLQGGELVLERDVSEVDRFGRLLRYIWLRHPSGEYTFVNLELVLAGYAQVATYPPDIRYVDVFLAALRDAREAGRGLWAP